MYRFWGRQEEVGGGGELVAVVAGVGGGVLFGFSVFNGGIVWGRHSIVCFHSWVDGWIY